MAGEEITRAAGAGQQKRERQGGAGLVLELEWAGWWSGVVRREFAAEVERRQGLVHVLFCSKGLPHYQDGLWREGVVCGRGSGREREEREREDYEGKSWWGQPVREQQQQQTEGKYGVGVVCACVCE